MDQPISTQGSRKAKECGCCPTKQVADISLTGRVNASRSNTDSSIKTEKMNKGGLDIWVMCY
jgi:hypothetical protein